jgi:hypothetical protein
VTFSYTTHHQSWVDKPNRDWSSDFEDGCPSTSEIAPSSLIFLGTDAPRDPRPGISPPDSCALGGFGEIALAGREVADRNRQPHGLQRQEEPPGLHSEAPRFCGAVQCSHPRGNREIGREDDSDNREPDPAHAGQRKCWSGCERYDARSAERLPEHREVVDRVS